jgi:hypothetical protein
MLPSSSRRRDSFFMLVAMATASFSSGPAAFKFHAPIIDSSAIYAFSKFDMKDSHRKKLIAKVIAGPDSTPLHLLHSQSMLRTSLSPSISWQNGAFVRRSAIA